MMRAALTLAERAVTALETIAKELQKFNDIVLYENKKSSGLCVWVNGGEVDTNSTTYKGD